MSILRSIFGRETVYDSGPWGQGMVPFRGPGQTDVNTDSALCLSAVFACMRLISEAVATMPLDVFVRADGARLPLNPQPDYLAFQPPSRSRIDYLSELMMSLLSDGNAFVATPRDDLGVPLDLVVIDPSKVEVVRDEVGRDAYRVGSDTYGPLDVMHIKGMTLPGRRRGLSPLGYARETIELGLNAQRFGAAFFANGALPSAVIEAPGQFSQEAADRVSAVWNSRHQGTGNAAKVGVLTNGAKFARVTIAPDEAQFLQTRQFQVPDVARVFGVPPHLIADASNSTSWGSGLAEQNLAFGQFSLRPWVDRIEEAHGRLLTSHGERNAFVRLNMNALLRAGTTERYEAHRVGIASGFETVNEARLLEDLPPLPELPSPEPEVAAALDLARAAPSLVQNPGLPALVDQLRLLNGKAPLNPAPAQELIP